MLCPKLAELSLMASLLFFFYRSIALLEFVFFYCMNLWRRSRDFLLMFSAVCGNRLHS